MADSTVMAARYATEEMRSVEVATGTTTTSVQVDLSSLTRVDAPPVVVPAAETSTALVAWGFITAGAIFAIAAVLLAVLGG